MKTSSLTRIAPSIAKDRTSDARFESSRKCSLTTTATVIVLAARSSYPKIGRSYSRSCSKKKVKTSNGFKSHPPNGTAHIAGGEMVVVSVILVGIGSILVYREKDLATRTSIRQGAMAKRTRQVDLYETTCLLLSSKTFSVE